MPDLVRDPVALIKDVRTLVERHCKDKADQENTGVPVLQPPGDMHTKFQVYDRTRVKQEMKQEIARKNAEIIREQKELEKANAAAAGSESSLNSNFGHFMPNSVITHATLKREPTENGVIQQPPPPQTNGTLILP